MKKSKIGERFENKKGQSCIIIKEEGYKKITVEFEDGSIRSNINYHNLKTGSVKNLNLKDVVQYGCIGNGCYGTKHFSYNIWANLLKRCKDEKVIKINPTYKDITVCEEWRDFQNFAQWCEDNWKPYMEGWQLDKDILVKNNKTYSPETCCFVPQEINKTFTKSNKKRGDLPIGVGKNYNKYISQIKTSGKVRFLGSFDTLEEAFQAYKIAKEEYIKEVADKWKDLIDPRVYQAMYNYQVEITD